MKSNNAVIISKQATLTSTGTHTYHTCKPIIAIDIHRTFNSLMDAAEYFGCSYKIICNTLRGKQSAVGIYERDENGKRIRKIGTCRLVYAAYAETAMDAIMETGRNTTTELEKVKAENKALNEELKEYRAWKAEQERIRKEEEARLEAERKAKEAHEKAIANAKEKIERRKRIERDAQEKYQFAIARRQQAEKELAELEGNHEPIV